MIGANLALVPPHKKANNRNSVLRELREMQMVAYALVKAADTKPSDVAQLMRAHVAAEQQRNILRMRPAPKPIDVSTLHPKPKRTAGLPKAAAVTAVAPTTPIAPEPAPECPGAS
jgi:hypothetical protein